MTPRSVVQPITGAREGEAGVVESVEKNRGGEVVSLVAKMDIDGELVTFSPDEVRILYAH